MKAANDKAPSAAVKATAEAKKPAIASRAVSDPRDVAALVMARMNAVNGRKDDLTIAIKGLSDITLQLARTYGEQLKVIASLTQRVKALEAAASTRGGTAGNGAPPPATTASDEQTH